MDDVTKLLHEIYKDAYLQGREDGLDGIHIDPQMVLKRYLTDETVRTKLTQLGYIPVPAI